MKVSETILLGFFVIFAGVLLFNSLDMPYSSGHSFGAGFLPLNMSVAIIILVGIIAGRGLLSRKRSPVQTHGETKRHDQAPGAEDKQKSFVAPISTIVLMLAATAAMGFGSVLLPLAVLILVVSALFLGNTWFRSIRMTIIALASIYLIFSVWLGIPIH